MKTTQTKREKLASSITGAGREAIRAQAETGKAILDALINASESFADKPAQHSPLPWRLAQDDATILCGDKDDPEIVASTCVNDPTATAIDTQDENAAYIVRACNNAQRLADALKFLADQVQLGKLNIRKDFGLINAHAGATKALHQWEGAQQ